MLNKYSIHSTISLVNPWVHCPLQNLYVIFRVDSLPFWYHMKWSLTPSSPTEQQIIFEGCFVLNDIYVPADTSLSWMTRSFLVLVFLLTVQIFSSMNTFQNMFRIFSQSSNLFVFEFSVNRNSFSNGHSFHIHFIHSSSYRSTAGFQLRSQLHN